MRISDWSSDVCSSDLAVRGVQAIGLRPRSQPSRLAQICRSQIYHLYSAGHRYVTNNDAAGDDDLERFLNAHPDIRFFEVLFTAMSGVPRGKRLRRHEMRNVFDYGRFLPGSILVNDITGQDRKSTRLNSSH